MSARCHRPRIVPFTYAPADPSVLDAVQFRGGDVRGVWSFGDGATASGRAVAHRFAADGDYTVTYTAATTTTLVVRVRTHDVSITALTAPRSAAAGELHRIVVTVGDTHYPELVQVDLLRATPPGWSTVGTLSRAVDASGAGAEFCFDYLFTGEDARLGEVRFRAIAAIRGARDAFPSDNDLTAPATRVTARRTPPPR